MKNFLIYIVSFIIVCFIMPVILTKRDIKTSYNAEENAKINIDLEQQNTNEELDNVENKSYDYKKYGTIELLHKKTGKIESINIDEYLCNVVSAEMPASFEMEALKAQAIVARTYTVYKAMEKKHENADICDDSTCCQAWISKEDRMAKWEEDKREMYWEKICNAVNTTKGKIICYENNPINAFFHSNSGGMTELPVNVWGGSDLPYLKIVETSGEDAYSQYLSQVIYTKDELLNKLKEKYSDILIDFSSQDDIKILEYTEGNRVKTIKFGNHNLSGVETRSILGLKSTNFEIIREDEKIKFSVKGYGHGVGMSQTGSDSMAKQGSTAEEIIKYFYADVEIKDINSL